MSYALNHQFLYHDFNDRSNKVHLKHSQTQFAYIFLVLGRLSTCNALLRLLFPNDKFRSFTLSSIEAGTRCMLDSENTSFRENVSYIEGLVQPIVETCE